MADDVTEVHGPVDYLILEAPTDQLRGEAAAALADLVESGIVRLWDLLVVQKAANGDISVLELADDGEGGFSAFAGARSGLLGDDDVAEAANAIEPGKTAALIVYENAWAIPFVAAARRAGVEVVASGRIPADAVMQALDDLEAAEAAS